MLWSIALSGNDALHSIVHAALAARSGHTTWSLTTRHASVFSQAEPDMFASPMIERTKQRAREAMEHIPGASLGIALEHGTIRVAVAVNLSDLHILDMSPEELRSPKLREEIRNREAEAQRISPLYEDISAIAVVDAQGEIFNCFTCTHDKRVSTCFTWDGYRSAYQPELVDVRKRIRNHVAFVQALSDSVHTYHLIMTESPKQRH